MKRRDFIKLAGISATSLLLGMANKPADLATNNDLTAATPPNFILILSDDQGWTGTSVQIDPDFKQSASDYIETRNLEKMAKKGMCFSNAYAPSIMCSPTRYSIQFGKTTARLLKTHNYGPSPESMERIKKSQSIAQMLKASNKGYITAHLGKWHINPSPEALGYDVSDGPTDNPDGSKNVPADDPKKIFSLTKRANQFMQDQVEAKKPFYLQISHYAVHLRLMALKKTEEKYENKDQGKWHYRPDFAGCTEDLDTSVGMILEKIKELGIEDNTYIIYTSDNGALAIQPPMQKVNMPLRRGKFCAFEGGIRVPFIVTGPGVKPGTHCNENVIGYDILPTIHDLAQIEKTMPADVDGGSLKQVLENQGKGKIERQDKGIYFHCTRGKGWTYSRLQSAVRIGDYKLLKNYYNDDELLLFNVESDRQESNNLAEKMPEKTKELHEDLQNYLKKVKADPVIMTAEDREEIKNQQKNLGKKPWGRNPELPTEYPLNSSI